MSAAAISPIAFRISSTETFAVRVIAMPIMLRVIRIVGSVVAAIFLAAIQAIAIALLYFLATRRVAATIIPSTVLCLRRGIENHANAQQEHQYKRGSQNLLLQSIPIH